jgi:hypothetical protein
LARESIVVEETGSEESFDDCAHDAGILSLPHEDPPQLTGGPTARRKHHHRAIVGPGHRGFHADFCRQLGFDNRPNAQFEFFDPLNPELRDWLLVYKEIVPARSSHAGGNRGDDARRNFDRRDRSMILGPHGISLSAKQKAGERVS